MNVPTPNASAASPRLRAVLTVLLVNAVPLIGIHRYGWSAANVLGKTAPEGGQNVGGGAVPTVRPNWRATCPMSTGFTGSSPDGPPKSSIEVTCSPW